MWGVTPRLLHVEHKWRMRISGEVMWQSGDYRLFASIECVEEAEGIVARAIGPEALEEGNATVFIVERHSGGGVEAEESKEKNCCCAGEYPMKGNWSGATSHTDRGVRSMSQAMCWLRPAPIGASSTGIVLRTLPSFRLTSAAERC